MALSKDPNGDSVFGSKLGPYYTKISIGDYSRPKPFGAAEWKKNKVIILPLPNVLRDDTSVNYDNVNLELIGDIVNSDWSGLGAKAATQIAASAASAIVPNFIGNAIKGSPVQRLGDALEADKIASAIQQSMGTAPNPNATVAFTGPELRSFSFSWSLQPRNNKESENIKRIISYLKKSALPSNDLSGSTAILKYPALAQINFYPWDNSGSANEWGWGEDSIIKIKRCFLGAVNVNYSPSNVPAFFEGDNRPVAIELTIEFREIEYMLSNDWGGSTGNNSLMGYFGNLLGAYTQPFRGVEGTENLSQQLTDGIGAPEDETQAQP